MCGMKRQKCTSCPFGAWWKRCLVVDDAKAISSGAKSGVYGVREGGHDATQMGEGKGLMPLVGSTGRRARTERGPNPHHQGRHEEEEPWIDEGQCGHRARCGRPGATHSDGPPRRAPASARAPPGCCGSAGPTPRTPSATPTDALPCADQRSAGKDCGARKCGGECGAQRNVPPLGGGEGEETRTGSVEKQRKCGVRKCGVRNCRSQECGTESGGSGGCGGGFHH